MANNFRKTGTYYISKDGNDGNAGTTADLPKKTLARYGNVVHIVGCGEYRGAINLGDTCTHIADGFVKIDATGDVARTVTSGQEPFIGTSLERYFPFRFELNGFRYFVTGDCFHEFYNVQFIGGIFQNNAVSPGRVWTMKYSVFKNTNITLTSGVEQDWDYCSFFNSSWTSNANAAIVLKNSYADASTQLKISGYFATASDFSNNNFQGYLTTGGLNYELKRDKAGNAIDPNPSYLDWIALDATVYDRGNFSQDPEFKNIAKNDFRSVEATSPLLFASSSGGNISDVILGTSIKVLVDSAMVSDLLVSSGDYIYDTGAGSGFGTATFDAVNIAPIAQIIEYAQLVSILNFNSDEAIGGGLNTNVPIVDNFTAGTAGANPRRLTYQMRWSISETQPTLSSEWDNDGLVTAGNYSKFEHFNQPKIDIANLGNGDPLFNPSGAVSIRATWVQLKITITEGIG